MTAVRDHTKHIPFVSGEPLPYVALFSSDQYEKLSAGLVPTQMEDKWSVFFEPPYLHFHRSWTGHAVYRVKIVARRDGFMVAEALWESSLAQHSPEQKSYQAELLDFLVSNLLLGMCKPFPQPQGVPGPLGLLQHHVAGTGYPEAPARSAPEVVGRPARGRPRWMFWR
jgi:hypothetical protein